MTEPQRIAWTLLCPLRGVRAELELEVGAGRPVVRACSVKRWAPPPCDTSCMRWFGRPAEETPAMGEAR